MDVFFVISILSMS